mgnify:CR=1 FL=1
MGSQPPWRRYWRTVLRLQPSSRLMRLLPMLLGGVFQATGNSSPMTVPAKGRYVYVDFKRFADGYGVPLNMNPHFPIITTTLMRMVTALQMHNDPRMQTFMDAVFHAFWVN